MDHHNMYQYDVYYPYRAKEMIQRADQERLALRAVSGQRKLRFYYPAMARFGRWLTASGQHLQKRYGEICDVSASKPAQRGIL
jgi:hypothetical protein